MVRPPITDSAWFWVMMFAGMALAALVAIGPKYGGRQARLERQYQARERIAAKLDAAPRNGTDKSTSGQTNHRDFATAGDTLIPLWPLAAVLLLVIALAAIMLYRGQTIAARQYPRPDSPIKEGPP